MRRFPAEFMDLLTSAACRRFAEPSAAAPITLFNRTIPTTTARACLALLERRLGPLLRTFAAPIPLATASGMHRNYSESLAKTMRLREARLVPGPSPAYRVAKEIGLADMLRSDSLHRIAENVSGYALDRHVGRQVLCYRHGDYSGPHNDHHPEIAHLREGYVDVHISFSNDAVRDQRLVYERDGYLTESLSVHRTAQITVYNLPFWHYTTPLIGVKNREAQARRWLLLTSFAHSAS